MTETRWRMRGRMPVPEYAPNLVAAAGSGALAREGFPKSREGFGADAKPSSQSSVGFDRLGKIAQTEEDERPHKIVETSDARNSAVVGKSRNVRDLSQHPDLLGGSVRISDSDIHPDFLARAEIWRLQREGVISLAEASRRSAAIGQAGKSSIVQHSTPPRPRHSRPAPNPSRQYAPAMSTEAARDDRLTPNAKALLQVLRARCGKGRRTAITKGTMGAVMSRSARTIRRYLVDLVRHGYVELEIAKTARGMHAGLVVQLTAKALPFFEEAKGLAAWLAEAPAAALKPFRPFRAVLSSASVGVTVLSPINQSPKDSFRQRLFSEGKKGESMPPRPS